MDSDGYRAGGLRKPGIAAAVAILLLGSHTYFSNQWTNFRNPNEYSRVFALMALSQRGTNQIDWYVENDFDIDDKAIYAGHFYSDKAPGVVNHLLPSAILSHVALGREASPQDFKLSLRMLGLSIPLVLFWFLTRAYWTRIAGSHQLGAALLIGGVLGSPLLLYGTQLFAHGFAAAYLFASFLLLERPGEPPPGRLAAAGFCACAALTCDYAVGFGVPVITAFAFHRCASKRSRFSWFPLGAAAPLLAWGISNQLAFGSPFELGQQHVADAYYSKILDRGVAGGWRLPDPSDLLPFLFGAQRGILYLTPVLALAPIGWARAWRAGDRATALVSAAVVVGSIGFALGLSYWRGGWSVGVRYFVPAIPFAMVGIAWALRGASPGSPSAVLFKALSVIGLAHITIAAATFPAFPEFFDNPLYELAWPLFRDGLWMPATPLLGVFGHAGWFAIMGCAALLVLSADVQRRTLAASVGAAALAAAFVFLFASTAREPDSQSKREFAKVAHILGYELE